MVIDRLSGLDVDFDRSRLLTRNPDLDRVHAGLERQMLRRSVEVVDNADVGSVREDLRVARGILDPDATPTRDRAGLSCDIV